METLITSAERRRRGLILTADLEQLGVGPAALRDLVSERRLVRVRRGVCVRANRWSTLAPAQRYRELVRSMQYTSVRGLTVMGPSAAVMHGLPIVGPAPTRVHALVPEARGGSSNRYLASHLGPPDPDAVEIDGLLVTSLARTLVDVARTDREMSSIAALDHALRTIRTGEMLVGPGDGWSARPRRADLYELLEVLDPRVGARRAMGVIEFASPLAMSVGESVSRFQMSRLGFADPVLQQRFRLHDGAIADGDFWWESVRLLGEFDGRVKYLDAAFRGGLSAQEVVVKEKAREDALRALGLGVARWTWDDAMDEVRFGALLDRSGVPRK